MILNKRIIRDLKENFFRYFALIIMIALGMMMVIGLCASADTVMEWTHESSTKNQIEDGQFSTFVPLSEETVDELRKNGITIEENFYCDYWALKTSKLRVFKTRKSINLIVPDEGTKPVFDSDIFLEQNYAKAYSIAMGDSITIGETEYIVCGIGSAPDYENVKDNLSDIGVDSKKFSIAFVSDTAYEKLCASGLSDKAETYQYSFRLNDKMTADELKHYLLNIEFDENLITDKYLREMLDNANKMKNEINDGVAKLSDGTNQLSTEIKKLADENFSVNIPNLTSFINAEDNSRIGSAGKDVVINKVGAILGGVILLILISYVISVFVIHSIDKESQVIGALYSLGYVKKELLGHYLILPTIISFLGGGIGTLLGVLTTSSQYEETLTYFSFPHPVNVYKVYLFIYGLVMPPLVSVIVNLLVINKKLSQSPLKMLRHEKKENRINNVNLGRMSFVNRFKIRQMLREIRASLTLCGGMLIALIFMMISLNCYTLIDNLKVQNNEDTKFEYMYTLKYPTEIPPENAEACYAETLSREIFGLDFDVTVMGIDDDNKYYDFDVSELKASEIAVSSSTAYKFKISDGDNVTFVDKTNNKNYTFTAVKIVPYSVGLQVFMNIDSMRESFVREDDYYNVLLTDGMINIDSDRVYSIVSKEDITGFAEVMSKLMWGFILSIGVASIIVFSVVMYLMLKMMIDRSAFSISLVKIFGYNDSEVKKLYLGGSFWTVCISAVICVPTSKAIMDALYPLLISNVASGVDLTFSPFMYLFIFALIFISYFAINIVLTSRLRKISETEILKNRE